jgi:hypothetical protein
MTMSNQLDLFDHASMADTITLTGAAAQPAITINHAASQGLFAAPDSISIDWNQLNNVTPSSRIKLQGDDADIEINGESIMGMLRDIRDRLAILRVSDAMEAEWEELRELRAQYEAKLMECEEKNRAWRALQQRG